MPKTTLLLTFIISFIISLFLLLQPLFADGPALNADAGQAGGWAMLYRYGGIGAVVLWAAVLMCPQKSVKILPDVASLVLMGCVIWEAVVALEQLYGDGISNHALYRFTGTFLNPGPFCGFMAMGVPLAVHYLVKSDKLQATSELPGMPTVGADRCVRPDTSDSGNQGRHTDLPLQVSHDSLVALLTLILSLLLLPAGMSRSAWIAATTGGVAVYGMHRWSREKFWNHKLLRSRKRLMMAGATLVTLAAIGWGAFHLKEDSANGRLLMWKIACQAIAEQPWTGYDSEGFPAAYAEAQERYFAAGKGSPGEIYVAGTPDHAFNEYLTMAVRYGWGGLALLLTVGIAAVVCAIRLQAYGVTGALLAVAVFAFSSYPLQLPDFLAAVVVLVTVPICSYLRYKSDRLRGLWIVSVPLCLYIPLKGLQQSEVWQARHEAAKEWRMVRTLYHMGAYATACEDYAPLYERMRWNHNFLFEYGRALHQSGQYEESNRIMEEAERLCGDPMIINIQGKNQQALGEFDRAARLYRRAYNRLPNRIYPLYLEMEMYASPDCRQMEMAKELAQRIISTKEKVPSQAVEEMKKRAKELLND